MISMLRRFRQEVQHELSLYPPKQQGLFTEAAIAPLPEPVQRHLRVCDWMGKPIMSNAAVRIQRMELRMNLEQEHYTSVKSYQYNSVAAPCRLAYMKAAYLGLFPFAGRDKYQEGEGNMLIRLMNLFTLVDLKGPEMNRAALVTVLAETFLLPSYTLQPYLHWSPINAQCARATLQDGSTQVSGVFHFDQEGYFRKFVTNDRYLQAKGGALVAHPWIAKVSAYEARNGIVEPRRMEAYWDVPRGLTQYASLELAALYYDVTHADEVLP